jgi:hypothetical protein
MRSILWIFLLLLGVSGCEILDGPCDSILVYGILVNVMDSTTNGPVVTRAISVAATDGGYSDTFQYSTADPMPYTQLEAIVEDRPGTYRVEVSALGFAPWVRNEVRVREDGCHVRTAELLARMQPLGAT